MWSCHSTRRDGYAGPRVTKTLGTGPRLKKSQPTNDHCGVLCRRHTRMRGSLELVGKQLQGVRDYGTTSHQSTLLSACDCCEMTLVSMAVLYPQHRADHAPCQPPSRQRHLRPTLAAHLQLPDQHPQHCSCGRTPCRSPVRSFALVRHACVLVIRTQIRHRDRLAAKIRSAH